MSQLLEQAQALIDSGPMPSAPMIYNPDRSVAWDKMWGLDHEVAPFCKLALYGGPPHRGEMLRANPLFPEPSRNLTKNASEICRGVNLATKVHRMQSFPKQGMITFKCDSARMAEWMRTAILAENVYVTRFNDSLYLQPSAGWETSNEVKNVITAFAKTFHYWEENEGGE